MHTLMAKFPVEFPMVLPTGHLQSLHFNLVHFNTSKKIISFVNFLDSGVSQACADETRHSTGLREEIEYIVKIFFFF